MAERLSKWSHALGLGDFSAELLTETAANYAKLKKECFTFLVQTEGVDLNKFNPLSKVSVGNPWASQYDNQARLDEIKLDVDRTYQEVDFFRHNLAHQKAMINILFVFTKTHQLGYRQGMNELCAIFFYIANQGCDEAESVTYELFTRLLVNWGHKEMFLNNVNGAIVSPILVRCEEIFRKLEKIDPRLHKHLLQNDVSANLFLVRWIRLLFSREFSFESIFTVWDFLLSGEIQKNVDCFALAMIVNSRTDLLQSDSSGCFMKLLQYSSSTSLDSLFELSRDIACPPSVPKVKPESLSVLDELSGTISELKKKNCVEEIRSEISKLEDIFVRLKK